MNIMDERKGRSKEKVVMENTTNTLYQLQWQIRTLILYLFCISFVYIFTDGTTGNG